MIFVPVSDRFTDAEKRSIHMLQALFEVESARVGLDAAERKLTSATFPGEDLVDPSTQAFATLFNDTLAMLIELGRLRQMTDTGYMMGRVDRELAFVSSQMEPFLKPSYRPHPDGDARLAELQARYRELRKIKNGEIPRPEWAKEESP